MASRSRKQLARLVNRILHGDKWSTNTNKTELKQWKADATKIAAKAAELYKEQHSQGEWEPLLGTPTENDIALVKQAQAIVEGAASAPAPREVTREQLRKQQDMFKTDNDREAYRGALGLYGLNEARNTADLRKKLGARTDWPPYVKAGMEAFIKSVEQGGDAPAPAAGASASATARRQEQAPQLPRPPVQQLRQI